MAQEMGTTTITINRASKIRMLDTGGYRNVGVEYDTIDKTLNRLIDLAKERLKELEKDAVTANDRRQGTFNRFRCE